MSRPSNTAEREARRRLIGLLLVGAALLLLVCVRLGGPSSLPVAEAAFDFDLNEPPPAEQDELSERDESEAGENPQPQPKEPGALGGGVKWLQSKLSMAAGDIKLPQYFSFSAFANQFKRKYSAVESAVRRSIFLQNCISVFKERVAYRRGTKSYLTAINKFADQSTGEFQRRFMVMPPIESNLNAKRSSADYFMEFERRQRELERELAREQERLQSASLEGVSRCSAADLQGRPDECRLVDLDAELTRELAELLDAEPAALEELQDSQIERESQFSAAAPDEPDELPWPGRLQSHLDGAEERRRLGTRSKLDWSRHGCFHEVYDQGLQCGKCYVLAATALAEFYKCSELDGGVIKRRKFSKDYVLDCAPKFSASVMGCAGGSPLDTLRFIAHAGIFNIRDWRLRRQEEAKRGNRDKCPLERAETPLEQWGPTRVIMNPRAVELHQRSQADFQAALVEALQDGPLVVSVQMPTVGVQSYAGGVHDGEGCAVSGYWHAMLLVGYGRDERGQAYWRFRNSFGPDWGDQGHFHLSLAAPGACFASAVRVYREPLAA